MSDVRQKVDRLRDVSDALLAEMEKLKALEQEKRRTDVSSARFDALAGDIEKSSRRIFALAAEERAIGEFNRLVGRPKNPKAGGAVRPSGFAPARTGS